MKKGFDSFLQGIVLCCLLVCMRSAVAADQPLPPSVALEAELPSGETEIVMHRWKVGGNDQTTDLSSTLVCGDGQEFVDKFFEHRQGTSDSATTAPYNVWWWRCRAPKASDQTDDLHAGWTDCAGTNHRCTAQAYVQSGGYPTLKIIFWKGHMFGSVRTDEIGVKLGVNTWDTVADVTRDSTENNVFDDLEYIATEYSSSQYLALELMPPMNNAVAETWRIGMDLKASHSSSDDRDVVLSHFLANVGIDGSYFKKTCYARADSFTPPSMILNCYGSTPDAAFNSESW